MLNTTGKEDEATTVCVYWFLVAKWAAKRAASQMVYTGR